MMLLQTGILLDMAGIICQYSGINPQETFLMRSRILLIGAGHAHLEILKNLDRFTGRGHTVTVVSPSEFHYYSGMGPGMLAGIYTPEETRFAVKEMTETAGCVFINENVRSFDPDKKSITTDSGNTLFFDYTSLNVGSVIPDIPSAGMVNPVFSVKPIENFIQLRKRVLEYCGVERVRLIVIGGGAAGIETASALWRLCSDNDIPSDLTLVSFSELLAGFSQSVRNAVRRSLLKRRVRIIEGSPVKGITDSCAELGSGESLSFDIAVNASGTMPPAFIRESGITCGPGGGLLVDSYLRSESSHHIFGGGDCIDFSPVHLRRIGVYAVRQAPVLLHNLLSVAEGVRLRKFVPQKKYLGILNTGDSRGVLFRGRFTIVGRTAFFLKDRIDRSFIKRFRYGPRSG